MATLVDSGFDPLGRNFSPFFSPVHTPNVLFSPDGDSSEPDRVADTSNFARRCLFPLSPAAESPEDVDYQVLADRIYRELTPKTLVPSPREGFRYGANVIVRTFDAFGEKVDTNAFEQLLDLVRKREISPDVVDLLANTPVDVLAHDAPGMRKIYIAIVACIYLLGSSSRVKSYLEEQASSKESPRSKTPPLVLQRISPRGEVADSASLVGRVHRPNAKAPSLWIRLAIAIDEFFLRHLQDACYDILYLKVYRTAETIFSTVLRAI